MDGPTPGPDPTLITPARKTPRRGWLIITRARDEEIIVDGRIVIRLVDIRGERARIGIKAPTSVIVARREIATPEQLAAIPPEVGP